MTNQTADNTSHLFAKLGLTRRQTDLYLLLIKQPHLTAVQLANLQKVSPTAVYRPLTRLTNLGLVIKHSHPAPAHFSATPPDTALELLHQYHVKKLARTKTELTHRLASLNPASNLTKVKLIQGQQATFDHYCQLADKATSEIYIISIGETIPRKSTQINLDAIQRGVDLRIIVHQYHRQNAELISSWIKMGWKVRHHPDSGYHLVIIDTQHIFISVNNPVNTNDRITTVFTNPNLARAMRRFFLTTWQSASPITKDRL